MGARLHAKRGVEAILTRIREASLRSASPETSCYPEQYRRKRIKSRLYLHCAAVATVVQVLMGGDIVTGRVKGVQHYWNRLPDGKEVDLTSCQFGGDGYTPFKKGRKVKRKGLTDIRFLMFAQRVKDNL
jgi:hypothetical protein